MQRHESSVSAEQPLLGVMLCFTSIGPEERTRYADLAKQMGADHKLDLTSDTTHLVVGSTDTLKYQYVAREREDIKVIQPQWIEAARAIWMQGLPLDLTTLTQQHRVPALAGLKICITGFDDLSFRAQLQKNVQNNGGQYTGDLTKDVTHLIAAKPEGKKYEYGMQWQTKVVTLKWYKDTLERGMQLDEKLYHPTVSGAEQGVGAWNRKPQNSPQLGKRSREELTGPEPPRKLRRTASARLGNQSQDMWSDIVGGAGFDAQDDRRPPLKPSVSMPALRGLDTGLGDPSDARRGQGKGGATTVCPNGGILSGYQFLLQCLDQKKSEHLGNILSGLGACVVNEDETQAAAEPGTLFAILPHDVAKRVPIPSGVIPDDYQVVSELWLEKCMIVKSFIAPQSYPLGHVLREPRTSLKDFAINVSGFDVIENVHIVKIISLLGGTYAKALSSAVSMLICRSAFARKEKLELAHHLGIPVVTEEFLWSTLRSQSRANVNDYLVQPLFVGAANVKVPVKKPVPAETHDQNAISRQKVDDRLPAPQPQPVRDSSSLTYPAGRLPKAGVETSVHQESAEDAGHLENHESFEGGVISKFVDAQPRSHLTAKHPLREVSPTSARRNSKVVERPDPPLESLDGSCSMEDPEPKKSIGAAAANRARAVDIVAINGAIRDMLDARSKKKADGGKVADESKRKGRLTGRALSNLSNSSAKSNVRQSRASSINSINTDGVGSELVAVQSGENQSGEVNSAGGKSSFSFMGRAKTTLGGLSSAAIGMDDPDLARSGGFPVEQDVGPRMTQLGYEDPEEAVLLREKLAASRRKRSKKDGGDETEPQDDESKAEATKPKAAHRKIRDDDMLADADSRWGAGRRTRHKQRSPEAMKEF